MAALAGSRPAWRRLSPSSFVLAALTAVIVWAAVASLLSQGRRGAVLGAGRAELAAPLLLVAGQLAGPFRALD